MKKILLLVLLTLSSLSLLGDYNWKHVDCLYYSTPYCHLQGIDIADGKIFWSYTTMIIRTDADGKIEKIIEAPSHHGDCCVHDGKLYVAVNEGTFNTMHKAKNSIWVYDTDLNWIKVIELPSNVQKGGLGGITYFNGSFYTCGGVDKTLPAFEVTKWSKDFKLERVFNVPVGDSNLGVQTICGAYGRIWLGVYLKEGKENEPALYECDEDLNIIKKHNVKGVALGIAPIKGKNGENFMVAWSHWNNKFKGYYRQWASVSPKKIELSKE